MNAREKLHKELRTGYTTGTCAAAIAKGATYMLVNQEILHHISVVLPKGEQVVLELLESAFSATQANCAIKKDAGDDPDITNGIMLYAEARFMAKPGISIVAAEGIGQVTKPGLAVKPGNPAINPVPLKMIKDSVNEILPKGKGIEIKLRIPEGEKIAKRTFNPKLGIVGGISILGTTGIVKPMSEDALKASLIVELKQLTAYGYTAAIFSPGNYGKAFSKEYLQLKVEKIVTTSNYIGFMLEQAVKHKLKEVLLVGHLGKLVKLAGGIFHTHSRVADARNEILSAHYYQYSGNAEAFKQIMLANTTDEAVDFIAEKEFWNHLSDTIKRRAENYVFGELKVEVVLFSHRSGQLGKSKNAMTTLNNIINE
ncbi:MAG: cobalamin biosynthesis protein CbiD [Bacteroidia bacterium]|nr:MAG: cobalamin biosynthesis protein CbiD [Bacteroidia bacterium]